MCKKWVGTSDDHDKGEDDTDTGDDEPLIRPSHRARAVREADSAIIGHDIVVGEEVKAAGARAIVVAIHDDGDLELTWPDYVDPTARYTMNRSDVVRSH